jgi:hypothetical protein
VALQARRAAKQPMHCFLALEKTLNPTAKRDARRITTLPRRTTGETGTVHARRHLERLENVGRGSERGSALLKLGLENVLARSCSCDHRFGLVTIGAWHLGSSSSGGVQLYRALSISCQDCPSTFEQFRQGVGEQFPVC